MKIKIQEPNAASDNIVELIKTNLANIPKIKLTPLKKKYVN